MVIKIIYEYLLSVFWSFLMAAILLTWVAQQFIVVPDAILIHRIMPGWTGVLIILTAMLQFIVSLIIDSRYEKNILKYYFWMIWYPMFYWMINTATMVAGAPRGFFKKQGQRAIWKSPDRGIR